MRGVQSLLHDFIIFFFSITRGSNINSSRVAVCVIQSTNIFTVIVFFQYTHTYIYACNFANDQLRHQPTKRRPSNQAGVQSVNSVLPTVV